MIFFTSDTHFCHNSILHLADRPFADLAEMHETLVANWNVRVGADDEIYILGDFLYKGTLDDMYEIIRRLNGKKYLIRGNHDHFLHDPAFDASCFEWVREYDYIFYNRKKIVLFHYPILEWDGYYKNAIHLYGHIHRNRKENMDCNALSLLGKRALNVSVEFHNYYPWSINEVLLQTGQPEFIVAE